MVHFADLSWDKPGEEVIKEYHRGQQVTAKVTNVDSDRCRISLSIKHLTEDPFEDGDEKAQDWSDSDLYDFVGL